MSKFSKYLLIILVVCLTACNRPLVPATQPPTDIEATQDSVEDTQVPAQPANTAEPEETITPPTQEDPTPQPPPPTEDPALDLPAERLPLLVPGVEFTLQEVELMDASTGWGIAVDSAGIGHILKTRDGGITWGDITPPEPLNAGSSWFYPVVDFSSVIVNFKTHL